MANADDDGCWVPGRSAVADTDSMRAAIGESLHLDSYGTTRDASLYPCHSIVIPKHARLVPSVSSMFRSSAVYLQSAGRQNWSGFRQNYLETWSRSARCNCSEEKTAANRRILGVLSSFPYSHGSRQALPIRSRRSAAGPATPAETSTVPPPDSSPDRPSLEPYASMTAGTSIAPCSKR